MEELTDVAGSLADGAGHDHGRDDEQRDLQEHLKTDGGLHRPSAGRRESLLLVPQSCRVSSSVMLLVAGTSNVEADRIYRHLAVAVFIVCHFITKMILYLFSVEQIASQ